jgi:hypothetical protein
LTALFLYAALLLGALAHLLILIVAVRRCLVGKPREIVLCQIFIGFYLISIWSLVHSQGAMAGVGFILAGQFIGPLILLDAASKAPLIGFSALLIGVAAGCGVGWVVWRTKRLRLATLAGQITFALVAWLSAEAIVETTLRVRAAQQFPTGYCMLRRASVPDMISYGTADEFTLGTHATLVDGAHTYRWSFRRMQFDQQTTFWPDTLSLSLCSAARAR